MKAIIKVIKYNGGWAPKFTIGVQTFTIDITQPRTKKEAQWFADQLKTAFENLTND